VTPFLGETGVIAGNHAALSGQQRGQFGLIRLLHLIFMPLGVRHELGQDAHLIDALKSQCDGLDRFAVQVAQQPLCHGHQMPMMFLAAQIRRIRRKMLCQEAAHILVGQLFQPDFFCQRWKPLRNTVDHLL